MKNKIAISISLALTGLISTNTMANEKLASESRHKAEEILNRIDDISYGDVDVIKKDIQSDVRLRAMKEASQTVGAQEGYAYYIHRFLSMIEENEQYMRQFDFSSIMTAASGDARETYVLPPVIEKLVNAEAVNTEGTQLKLSGEVYRILSNVRLVTAPPTWRDYLIPPGFSNTNTPPEDLLPKNSEEQELWSKWVREGFRAGMNQGDREMRHRVAQLKTDFIGMVRYMNLSEKNMVKKPIVALQNIQVEGDGGQMKVRSSVYEVTQGAELNPQHSQWKANGNDNDRTNLK